MAKKKAVGIPGFPNKYANKLPGGPQGPFVTAVESMSNDEMKLEIFRCEKTIDECENDMDEDAALAKAKEDVKFLAGAYRDTLGCQKAKKKYIMHVRKQRGYA